MKSDPRPIIISDNRYFILWFGPAWGWCFESFDIGHGRVYSADIGFMSVAISPSGGNWAGHEGPTI